MIQFTCIVHESCAKVTSWGIGKFNPCLLYMDNRMNSDTITSAVTFTVVRTMSRIRSIPAIIAMPSSGRPTEDNTNVSTINPAPGTPALPIDAGL